MATTCTYENDAERDLHYRAMRRLSRESGVSEGEIQRLYEELLCGLRERARVRDYLAILVSRNVKDMLRKGSSQ